MNYSDAIKYLKEHDIKKEDGTYYEFGEVCNFSRLLSKNIDIWYRFQVDMSTVLRIHLIEFQNFFQCGYCFKFSEVPDNRVL